MKRIISIIAAAAALVLVASCNSKPSEDVVKAAAQDNATALVNAVLANDVEAIKAASVANATAPKTLGIEKYADLLALYDDAYESVLEDNMTTKEEVESVIKSRGIEIPVVDEETPEEAPEEAPEETPADPEDPEAVAADEAEAAAAAAAEGVAAAVGDAVAAVDDAVKEVVADVAGETLDVAAVEDIDIPFISVETKPTFQGGSANEFGKWVNSNIVYPENAKNAGKQGRVTLSFRVNKEGAVENVKVLRGVDPELDAEAVRVVSSSPAWVPGQQGGYPVNVTYTFPVIYKLQ